MDINCMENKITTANGVLQPTILTAILNLYNGGLRLMTARNVKEECRKIDKMTPWDKRIKAIYNAMRNATECGGRIIGEDKPSNDFTIAFDGNISNLNFSNEHSIPKITKGESKAKKQTNKSLKVNDISTNESFKALIEKLDWDKIKDKNKKKLLIIGCSDKKIPDGNTTLQNNYFNKLSLYSNLVEVRNENRIMYEQLLTNEPNYFIYKYNPPKRIKRNNKVVSETYFSNCIIDSLYLPAFERYSGDFYSSEHRRLYFQKNKDSNLHILIISGLYGIIEFRDSIIDYHFEMKRTKLWKKEGTTINDTIVKYIEAK